MSSISRSIGQQQLQSLLNLRDQLLHQEAQPPAPNGAQQRRRLRRSYPKKQKQRQAQAIA